MMNSVVGTEILDAATRLFLQYGYKRTTVDQIVAQVGIAKGSFYLHYPSKNAVFAAASQRLAGQVLEEMARIAAGDLEVQAKLHRVIMHPILYIWDFCHQAPHAPALWSELLAAAAEFAGPAYARGREILAGVVAEGQAQRVFTLRLSAATSARLVQLAVQGFDLPFRLIDSREQIENDLPLLVDLLIRGLKDPSSWGPPVGAVERL